MYEGVIMHLENHVPSVRGKTRVCGCEELGRRRIAHLEEKTKGVNFLRNCDAASVREYNKIIWFYQLS